MDSAALEALARFGNTLVGEGGETLETIRASREENEQRLAKLRARLDRAHRAIILREADLESVESGHTSPGHISVNQANAQLARLMQEFDESADPEALVTELEKQAEQLKDELLNLRRSRRRM